MSSTDSSNLVATCSENRPMNAGSMVLTDKTIIANVPAISGLITSER